MYNELKTPMNHPLTFKIILINKSKHPTYYFVHNYFSLSNTNWRIQQNKYKINQSNWNKKKPIQSIVINQHNLI